MTEEVTKNPLGMAGEPGGGGVRKKRGRPLAGYVEIYQTQLRAINRWISIGRHADPPEEPPLDQPEEMPAWWGRHCKNRVPGRILSAAARARGEDPGKTVPKPPAAPANVGSAEALSLVELLQSSRTTVSFLIAKQREEAAKGYNSDEFSRLQRDIDKMIEQIRKTESSIEAIRQKRGELVDIAKVRDELQRVHTAMAMSLENEIVDHFKIDRERARVFVNDWFAHLRGSEFTTGTQPAVAA